MTENSLTGLSGNQSFNLNQSITSSPSVIAKVGGAVPIWDVEEIEVFSLMLYK